MVKWHKVCNKYSVTNHEICYTYPYLVANPFLGTLAYLSSLYAV